MRILPINQTNNTNFKIKFELSNETLKSLSKSTRLSVEELENLPIDEATRLMKKRGAIKEPSKLKLWLADKYKKFGEKTGLLEKKYEFYSDGD